MQVVGGEVFSGTIYGSASVTIYRNESELADGEIVELQQQRAETDKVQSGQEFGANIRSRVDIAPGDIIESFEMIEQ
jgi:translation initiation factor IF-2